jgi:hypothetical protein
MLFSDKIPGMSQSNYFALTMAVVVFISACGNHPADATKTTDETAVGTGDTSVSPVSADSAVKSITSGGARTCFVGIAKKDTVVLSFAQSDSSVHGDLIYKFNEKDLNSGTIDGVMIGDTLVADYTFKSEGTSSIRQVVFLRRGNELIEGFGDVEDNNGRMIFRNLSTLTFDRSVVVKQIDCKNAAFIPAR